MKKFVIEKCESIRSFKDPNNHSETVVGYGEKASVSDGYHTMDELYDHRIFLYISLCRILSGHDLFVGTGSIWRSKTHSDGSNFDGWFILGINKENEKQITYHLPIERWDETEFAETLIKAPEFDGHTPADVLNRIKEL